MILGDAAICIILAMVFLSDLLKTTGQWKQVSSVLARERNAIV